MAQSNSVSERLSARKKPTQDRSQKMVERILEATREMLKERGGFSAARITTRNIAAKAGISVGSLYQYFPNTEAIIYELYAEILARVARVLDRFDSVEYLSLPREEFFSQLSRAMADAGPDEDIVLAMLSEFRSRPDLAEAERQHAERTSDRMAKMLQHFGSKWPIDKLRRLVLYLYYLDHGGWLFRDHANPPPKETLDWEVSVLNFLIMQCFDDVAEKSD